jgi:hypothetical protein
MAICYAEEDRALSHTTLWRCMHCLGVMLASLTQGMELFLKAFPESDIHRFLGSVSPRKYRSTPRAEVVRSARRLLNLMDKWDQAFPESHFFPRFATRASPS